VVPWRDHSVAIAGDDDNRRGERVIALGLRLEERFEADDIGSIRKQCRRSAERFM
jgi:hypothetical protein